METSTAPWHRFATVETAAFGWLLLVTSAFLTAAFIGPNPADRVAEPVDGAAATVAAIALWMVSLLFRIRLEPFARENRNHLESDSPYRFLLRLRPKIDDFLWRSLSGKQDGSPIASRKVGDFSLSCAVMYRSPWLSCATWMANITALGTLAIICDSLTAALPGAFLVACGETTLFQFTSTNRFATVPPAAPLSSKEQLQTHALQQEDTDHAPWVDEENSGSEVMSEQFEEISADGARTLRGWTQFRFLPGQKSLHVCVAFTRPLSRPVEAEVECECESGDAESGTPHTTPSGLRVELTRTPEPDALDGKLHWFVQADTADDNRSEAELFAESALP
ncbi:MAG: hypothetical protein U0892_21435 [Pirellulales bacterium]